MESSGFSVNTMLANSTSNEITDDDMSNDSATEATDQDFDVVNFMSDSRRDIASYQHELYVYTPCPESFSDAVVSDNNEQIPVKTNCKSKSIKHQCRCIFTKAQERGLIAGLAVGLLLSIAYISWVLLDNRFGIWRGDVIPFRIYVNTSTFSNETSYNVSDSGLLRHTENVDVLVTIRNPLFLGVLTQDKFLATRAAACNSTWARSSYVTRVEFFSNDGDVSSASLPVTNGLTVLRDIDENDYFHVQKTLAMIQQICSRHVAFHDWFMLSTDDVYIRVDQLQAFLAKKDPNKNWYIGHKTYPVQDAAYLALSGEPYCIRGPGLILSRALMTGICEIATQCFSQHPPMALLPDVLLAKCLRDHMGITCTGYNKLFVDSFEENEMNRLRHFMDTAEQTITLHPVKTAWTMDVLHVHHTETLVRRLLGTLRSLENRRQLLDNMTTLLSSHDKQESKDQVTIPDGRRRHNDPEPVEEAVFDDKMRIYKYHWCNAVEPARPSQKADISSVILLANTSLQLGEGLRCPRMLTGDYRRHELGASYSLELLCHEINSPERYVMARVNIERTLKPLVVKKVRKRKLKPDVIIIITTAAQDPDLFSYLLQLNKLIKLRHERCAIYLLLREETNEDDGVTKKPHNSRAQQLKSWWTGSHATFRVFYETKSNRARTLKNLLQDVNTHFPEATTIVTDTSVHITSRFIIKCKTLARSGKQMYYPYPLLPVLNNKSTEPMVTYHLKTKGQRPYCINAVDLESLVTPRDSLLSTAVTQKEQQLKVARSAEFDLVVRLI